MAVDHISDLQLLTGLMRIEVLTREALRHAERPDTQCGRIAEYGDDFVRQCRAQIIETVVRGSVLKGEDSNCGSVRKQLRALRSWPPEKPSEHPHENRQHQRGANPHGPQISARSPGSAWRHWLQGTRLQLALQPLQVGFHFSGALIACLSVLFQRSANNTFQFGRDISANA